MFTSMRIREETVEELQALKEKMHAHSLDEVVDKLIKIQKKKMSLFGAHPNLFGFNESEDRGKDREY